MKNAKRLVCLVVLLAVVCVAASTAVADSRLEFFNGSWASWRVNSSNQLEIKFEVRNGSRTNTVRAFELYLYPVDIWGNRLIGNNVYYKTTEKTIYPGDTAYSDYFYIPNADRIYRVYCGIHQVRYADGKVGKRNPVNYYWWDIK